MTNHFILYLLSVLTLNLLPGPDMLYIISQSMRHGKRYGFAAALGIGSGCFVHIFAVSAGLAALIFHSSLAFSIIKYAGAGYLLYLGWVSLTSRCSPLLKMEAGKARTVSWKKIYVQGLLVNVMNPKVAFFFLAFLPQFVITKGGYPISIQLLLLGLIFNCSGTLVNIIIAYCFGYLQQFFKTYPRALQVQQKITGIVLMGLGVRLAVFQRI